MAFEITAGSTNSQYFMFYAFQRCRNGWVTARSMDVLKQGKKSTQTDSHGKFA